MNPRTELTEGELRKIRDIEDGPGLAAARRRRKALARAMIAAREMCIDQEQRHERKSI